MDFRSESEIDHFLAGFANGQFPRYAWTHAAHIAMATAKLWAQEPLSNIRQGIIHYNETQGTANTESSGYHETLTVFWVQMVQRYLDDSGPASRLDAVRGAVKAFGRDSALPGRRYSFDVFQSKDARARWIPPDVDG